MSDDSKLSIDNMMELAMGLSMTSVFAKAMNAAYDNTQRMKNNSEIAAPPKYIHAIIGGQQKGPFSLGEIMGLIQSGEITLESYIWKPGMAEWQRAKDVDDIGLSVDCTPPNNPNL